MPKGTANQSENDSGTARSHDKDGNTKLSMTPLCPIRGADDNSSAEAKSKAIGGTFPMGLRNQTWHAATHFATDKPIVAVADGQVVAYRFRPYRCADPKPKQENSDEVTSEQRTQEGGEQTTEKQGEQKGNSRCKSEYSDNFVLLKHRWESPLGNELDYYSLYMHLDPDLSQEDYRPVFFSDFVVARSYAGGRDFGEDDTVRGRILFKSKDKPWDSKILIPNGAEVKTGNKIKVGSLRLLEVTYTDWAGTSHEGVIHRDSETDEGVEKKDGVTRIVGGTHTHMFKSGDPWDCCEETREGFGVIVRTFPSIYGVAINFIPNKTKVQFEPTKVPGWGKLILPIPEGTKGNYYIRTDHKNITRENIEQVDDKLLGTLQVPDLKKRLTVLAGDVLGKAARHFVIPKRFIHHEIFTLMNLLDTEAKTPLQDPKGDRYIAARAQYVVPAGRAKIPGVATGIELKEGDFVKIISNNEASTHIRVKVTCITRLVRYDWLVDHKKATQSTYFKKKLPSYSPKNLEQINRVMNGWVSGTDTLFYKQKPSTAERIVHFPCEDSGREFWIPKSCLNIGINANQPLTDTPDAVFTADPSQHAPEKISHIELKQGDYIKVLGESENKEYAHIQVTAVKRQVRKSMLEDKNKRKSCDYLEHDKAEGGSWYYKPKDMTALNAIFYNWVIADQNIFYISAPEKRTDKRIVLFPCGSQEKARFWIPKSSVDNTSPPEAKGLVDAGELFLNADVEELYFSDPTNVELTEAEITLMSPFIIEYDDTPYGAREDGWAIDITDIEPVTPYTWPGFELFYEDNEERNAFVDIDALKSVNPDLQATNTAVELVEDIKDGCGGFDMAKIADDWHWHDRLLRTIVRCPSEWDFHDEKYAGHEEKLGTDPEGIKKLIADSAFWSDLADKGVFDDVPENGKAGKEVFAFYPDGFLAQLDELTNSAMSWQQIAEVTILAQLVRAAAGDNWADELSCKALAACFYNRIRHHEWSLCSDLWEVQSKSKAPLQGIKEEEKATMLPWIADVVRQRRWKELPKAYVHFHASSENVDSQHWDTSVLDMKQIKKLGSFTFYRYRQNPRNYATEMTIKEIRLVSGGNKGESLPCYLGGSLSRKEGGEIMSYRYDMTNNNEWEMEFKFTIANGTEEQEKLKDGFYFSLKYRVEENGKKEYRRTLILVEPNNRFRLTIPKEADGYYVRLAVLHSDTGESAEWGRIQIPLRRKQYILFNGDTVQWMSEEGEKIPFDLDSGNSIDQLPAEGPALAEIYGIPEGNWRLRRDNISHSNDLFPPLWISQNEVSPFSNLFSEPSDWRLLIEPTDEVKDSYSETPPRLIRGATGGDGDIQIKDITVFGSGIEAFAHNFIARVPDHGEIRLEVNYSKGKFSWADTALAQLIGDHESRRKYYAWNRLIDGATKSHFDTKEFDVTNMTIKEIQVEQAKGSSNLFAVGYYQMTPPPLAEGVTLLKIDTNELFTKEIQDKLFAEYFITLRRKAVMKYFKGDGDVEDAAWELAMEWASFGVRKDRPISKGRIAQGGESYYSGDGYNKSGCGPDEVVAALKETKRQYEGRR